MTTVQILDSYLGIDPSAWDALVGTGGSPFLEHTFLAGLEALGCAVPATGWHPRPILVLEGDRLVGAAPGWVKTHSMGEFVYDHAWAQAAQANGIGYYPKLVVGVPFTPATGARLLVAPGEPVEAVRHALLAGLKAASEDCHGIHVLFDTEEEAAWLAGQGAFSRLQYQFHWHNRDYACFEDYVCSFPSKKRNKIRRERKELGGVRLSTRTAPSGPELDVMHGFYVRHTRQFGPWGRAYLNLDFFRHLGAVWGDRLHLVMAHDESGPVAGAFNVIKGDRLYGRYWGAGEEVPFLHFEVCYYQAIEECIRRGVRVFEPGHGGGHKYRRGFTPTLTWSSHALAEPRLHHALKDHAAREAHLVRQELTELGG